MLSTPYSGIRVLEIGSRIGASACGRLLADLGATVFVVEPRCPSLAPKGKWQDRISALAGKESVLVDPGNPDDVECIASLIPTCEAVILSSDADEAQWPDRWIQAIAKRPIVCDITAFGSTGPLAGRMSDESEIQAMTGIVDTTGLPEASPTPIGIPIVEMSSGLYAASAIAIALGVYFRTGQGQTIDIALYDVSINTLTTFLATFCAGKEPRRLGNGHGMAVPWNAYPTTDGWILICSTNDAQWKRLAHYVGPQAQAEKYSELKSRLQLRDDVDGLMKDWTTRHTLKEIERMLGEGGIPCGRIVKVANLADEPNLKQRHTVQVARDPLSGKDFKVCSATYRFLGHQPDTVHIPAPDSGRAFLRSPTNKLNSAGCVSPHDQSFTSEAVHRHTHLATPGQAPQIQALKGLRVIEIGQLTTAPLAARHLATLGADVIKVEPHGGESARAWAPLRNGTSHFFVASNGEKRSVELNLQHPDDRTYLAELIREADVLLENMKPGALAKMGLSYETLQAINPKIIYCAISGFGIHSFYPGRPAVDTVVQAMSGMMDTTRCGETPVKAGISAADIVGGQTGLLLIIAAIALRERTGQGCAIDISMQDVGASMTQHMWNGTTLSRSTHPISTVADACNHPQTIARALIVSKKDANGQSWEIIASPMRLSHTPPRLGQVIGEASKSRLQWQPI